VICHQKENYFDLFKGHTLENGDFIIVDQAPWVDIQIASYDDNLIVHILPNKKPFEGTEQHKFRTFIPDFILLRSYALGNYEHDWRNKINAFYHHDIPCLNSIDSFIWSVEKSSLFGKLRRVKKKMQDFPLIKQTYYSHPNVGSFPPDFPTVVKVGSSSQGVGKSRVLDSDQWKDMLSILSMSKEYFVTEPMIDWKIDVRVQKIGNHYRAIARKRMSEQSPWKSNEGIGISEEDVKVKKRWKKWIDAAAEECEMEICGMDLLVDEDGKEYILELNSSSIGLPQRHSEEDTGYIRDLVVEKMNMIFCNNNNVEKVEGKKKKG